MPGLGIYWGSRLECGGLWGTREELGWGWPEAGPGVWGEQGAHAERKAAIPRVHSHGTQAVCVGAHTAGSQLTHRVDAQSLGD